MFTNDADPVGAGMVASLARPGGNVTGLSGLAVELNTKRLEILKDAIPKGTDHADRSWGQVELAPISRTGKLSNSHRPFIVNRTEVIK